MLLIKFKFSSHEVSKEKAERGKTLEASEARKTSVKSMPATCKTNGPDEKARPPEGSLAIRCSLGAISGLGPGWDQARATAKLGTQCSVCCQAPEKYPRGA